MLKFFKGFLKKRSEPILILFIAALITLAALISQTKVVRITDGNKVIMLNTTDNDVLKTLELANIKLTPYDSVKISNDTKLLAEISIKRAFPVKVCADNNVKVIYLNEGTVKDALEKAGVTLGKFDFINKNENDPLYNDMEIKVSRVSIETVSTQTEIPYSIRRVESLQIPKGKVVEVTKGQKGIAESVVKNIYVDGKLQVSEVIEQKTIKEPVTAVLQIGKGGEHVTSRGESFRYSYYIDMVATAYTYGDGGKWGNVTATGKTVKVGHVAVDPKVIPLGTRLYIAYPNGKWVYGYAVAEDTGGAIKGNRIDLFFPTKQECKNFGRRTVRVYILD